MEHKELMIGDWVLINDAPHKVQAIDDTDAEIQAGDELYYVGEDRSHSEDKIEGIPLTYEIFKKNGWKYTTYCHEYQYGKNTIQCRLPYMVGRINGIDIENFKCEYVHQYQHLLRLCGLNELANNFKI